MEQLDNDSGLTRKELPIVLDVTSDWRKLINCMQASAL